MNPDELPEREWIELSYGQYTYREVLTGPKMCTIKHQIAAMTTHALHQFHDRDYDLAKQNAQLQYLLHTLASRYPAVQSDPDLINWLTNRNVEAWS